MNDLAPHAYKPTAQSVGALIYDNTIFQTVHQWNHFARSAESWLMSVPRRRRLWGVARTALHHHLCTSNTNYYTTEHRICTVGALSLNTIWTEQTSAAKGHIIERMRDDRRLSSLTLRWGFQVSYSFDSLLEIWRWLFRYQIYAQDTACGWKSSENGSLIAAM